jgi:hypothetical protein
MRLALEKGLEDDFSVDLTNFCPFQVTPSDLKGGLRAEGQVFVDSYSMYDGNKLPPIVSGSDEAEIELSISSIPISFDLSTWSVVNMYGLVVEGAPLEPMSVTKGGKTFSSSGAFRFAIFQTSDSIPDIVVGEIRFSNPNPTNGTKIKVQGNVSNRGCATAPKDIVFKIYDGDPASGGTEIGNIEYDDKLSPGEWAIVKIDWTVTTGSYNVYFVADTTNIVTELNENNNQLSASITVT